MVAFLLRIKHPSENTTTQFYKHSYFCFTHMQANRTQKYYSNIVKITHFFRLYSSTCAYINNRKCSYTIQYKGILYRKCALCKYGNIFMTFLECVQRKQRRNSDIWHTKVAMTLFGINTFSVLHSAGTECRLQLD